jgi:hypothetical protein
MRSGATSTASAYYAMRPDRGADYEEVIRSYTTLRSRRPRPPGVAQLPHCSDTSSISATRSATPTTGPCSIKGTSSRPNVRGGVVRGETFVLDWVGLPRSFIRSPAGADVADARDEVDTSRPATSGGRGRSDSRGQPGFLPLCPPSRPRRRRPDGKGRDVYSWGRWLYVVSEFDRTLRRGSDGGRRRGDPRSDGSPGRGGPGGRTAAIEAIAQGVKLRPVDRIPTAAIVPWGRHRAWLDDERCRSSPPGGWSAPPLDVGRPPVAARRRGHVDGSRLSGRVAWPSAWPCTAGAWTASVTRRPELPQRPRGRGRVCSGAGSQHSGRVAGGGPAPGLTEVV